MGAKQISSAEKLTFLDAFNEDEIRDLAVLYGLLHAASRKIDETQPRGVAALHKLPEWHAVMAFAKEVEDRLDGAGGWHVRDDHLRPDRGEAKSGTGTQSLKREGEPVPILPRAAGVWGTGRMG